MPMTERPDGYEITASLSFMMLLAALWIVVYGAFMVLAFVLDYRDKMETSSLMPAVAAIGGGALAVFLLFYTAMEWRRPSKFRVTTDGVAVQSRWRNVRYQWREIESVHLFRGAAVFRIAGQSIMDLLVSNRNVVIPYRAAGVKAEDFRAAVLRLRPDVKIA